MPPRPLAASSALLSRAQKGITYLEAHQQIWTIAVRTYFFQKMFELRLENPTERDIWHILPFVPFITSILLTIVRYKC